MRRRTGSCASSRRAKAASSPRRAVASRSSSARSSCGASSSWGVGLATVLRHDGRRPPSVGRVGYLSLPPSCGGCRGATPRLRHTGAVTCGNGRVTAGTALLVAVVLLGACSAGGGADAGPTSATTPSTQRSTTTTTPRSTSSTTTTTSTTASTTTTTTAPAIEVGNLQAGSNGPRTLALQERLKALKFDPGPVDGKFGPKTTAAV